MAAKGGHWKGGRFVRAKGGTSFGGGAGGRGGKFGGTLAKLRRGLKDADIDYIRDPSSFREESFAAVRGVYSSQMAKGKSATQVASRVLDPVRLSVEHTGRIYVSDGRHRLATARELGAKRVRAEVTQYGPRGGIAWKKTMDVPLR